MKLSPFEVSVLGGGCANCKRLKANVSDALSQLGIETEVIEITDYDVIAQYGVMRTPALVVNGVVKFSGRVPKVKELKEILSG